MVLWGRLFPAELIEHTNTVECANSTAKKRLKREGNILGSNPGKRSDLVRAIDEKCNGSLKRNGGDVMLKMQIHCIGRE